MQRSPTKESIYTELTITADKIVAGQSFSVMSAWVLGGTIGSDTTAMGDQADTAWGGDGRAVGVIYRDIEPGLPLADLTALVGDRIADLGLGCWDFSDITDGVREQVTVEKVVEGSVEQLTRPATTYDLEDFLAVALAAPK